MQTTTGILATLVAIGIGILLAPRANADGIGPCIASCNEECNFFIPGIRTDCKTACYSGRCGQSGALQVAGSSGEPGLNCEQDGVCNEFCADGPVPDSPDCDPTVPCPCNVNLIPMTQDIWQCTEPIVNAYPPIFSCSAHEHSISQGTATLDPQQGGGTCVPTLGLPTSPAIHVVEADIGCPGAGPVCQVVDAYRSVNEIHCITATEAQACSRAIAAYAIALDAVEGISVDFSTAPESCPPLEIP